MTGNREPRDPYLQRASEYLDGELSPRERRRFEEHLATCRECAAAVEALHEVVARAKSLDRAATPAHDLWPSIARRLTPRRRRWRLPWSLPFRAAWLRPALAAAAVVTVVCGSIVWLLHLPPQRPDGRASTVVTRPPATGAAAPGANEHEHEYEKRVAALQREAQSRLSADQHLVEVLDENVATLDAAIATYREALAQRPGDTYLRGRLDDAKRRKLAVLQHAVSMTTEGSN